MKYILLLSMLFMVGCVALTPSETKLLEDDRHYRLDYGAIGGSE